MAITSEVVVTRRGRSHTGSMATTLEDQPGKSGSFGTMMRRWRLRRRLSQLDLAIEAEVSARHVSFIETGRSRPSRSMVLRLASVLEVPAREQNRLLVAAGLAPAYSERSLDAPGMGAVREGVQRVLDAFDPYPCVVVDKDWWIVASNPGAMIERLRREVAASDSDELNALLVEIDSYPGGFADRQDLGGVAVPLELVTTAGRRLRFLSMVTTFGTALDLTPAELSIKAFRPADDATAVAVR